MRGTGRSTPDRRKVALYRSEWIRGLISSALRRRRVTWLMMLRKALGCAAEVFEQPIHGLGGAVRHVWIVEERHDFVMAWLQGLPQ